ncbi:MAG: PSD1 domain-containing protein [Planctomycetes bacterium]|nr:PSD1 domain-containing protein [Planctomycetota bacterium]
MVSTPNVTALLLTAVATAQQAPDFQQQVRPILANHCYPCHGPDDAIRKAGLRLDQRDTALQPAESGRPAIVPGDPEASELVRRITAHDADTMMPPPGANKPLPEGARELLVQWIRHGAEYPPHWAFVKPAEPPVPVVRDAAWPRNQIDRFVLARLEQHGLRPRPDADRWTLVRRAYLDLIGLPPTPAAAQAFVDDAAPDAWERLIDGLLAMPQYGEHQARRILDLARYADSNGYEKDRERSIWPWRDQVVRALNADQPFDQFTIEQLAGDMLPDATPEQIVATGFHRNTMLNEEGGIDPLEFRFHALTDRVATTGTTWLGLSLGCAQCHTHKFDPITQREYYAVMACMDNADDVEFVLPDAAAAAATARAQERAAQLLAALPDRYPLAPAVWEPVRLPRATAASGPAIVRGGGAIAFAAPTVDREAYVITFDSDLDDIGALRLDVLTDASLPQGGPGHAPNGNFVLSRIGIEAAPLAAPEAMAPVPIATGHADVEQRGFGIATCLDDDPAHGWAVDTGDARFHAPHVATFLFAAPVKHPGGTRFRVSLHQDFGGRHTLGCVRLSIGALAAGASPRAACERAFASWRRQQAATAADWTAWRPQTATSNLPLLTVQTDDSVYASGDITKTDTYELTFAAPPPGTTAIRLEALPDERLPGGGPGLGYYEGPKGDFFLGEFELFADGRKIGLVRASHSHAANAFGSAASAALAIDGDPQTGWSTANRPGQRHQAVFVLSEPLGAVQQLRLRLSFGRHYACSLGRFRIATTTRPDGAEASSHPDEVEQALLRIPADDVAHGILWQHFLRTAPELASARTAMAEATGTQRRTTTLALREREAANPRVTHRRHRGEYLQTRERVEPGAIAAVAPFPPELPRNRLGLARWIASADNPLTARVAVNRAWHAFFGEGIVRSLGDFGQQGEPPTHPELLDWLAVQFVRDGWSLKRLHRRLVLSATYRQDSTVDAAALAQDPDNRLLARGPRFRVDAEVVRDSVLAASGLLSLRMGGPGVHPPQPAGVTEIGFGSPRWPESQGEDRHRRSLYTYRKRTTPFAFHQTFDAPSGESCSARRDRSNTPFQALALLNDVMIVEAARAFGVVLAAMPGTDAERIDAGFRRCVVRPPDPRELATLVAFVVAQRQRLSGGELDAAVIAGTDQGDARELAVWTLFARVLCNLDELVTRT